MAALPRMDDSQQTSSSGNEVGGGGVKDRQNENKPDSECIDFNNSLNMNNNVLLERSALTGLAPDGGPLDRCGGSEIVGLALDGASEERKRKVIVKTKGALKCEDGVKLCPTDAPLGVIVNPTIFGSAVHPEDDLLNNRKVLPKEVTPKITSKPDEHKSSSSRSSSSKAASSSSRRG